MPRIAAPTVAEHRARQREAMVRAAKELALDEGPAAVTPGAVAAKVGVTRTAVYRYFDSTAALLAAVAMDAFGRWAETVGAAVADVEEPARQIEVYVRTTLNLVDKGDHRLAAVLDLAGLDAATQDEFHEMHRQLTGPLERAVKALGAKPVDVQVALVQSAVDAAVRQIEQGRAARTVVTATLTFVNRGLGIGV